MECFLIKKNNTYFPSLPEDEEKLKFWHDGEILKITAIKPRNGKFHRKFFALLNIAFNNQDKYDNFEDFRCEIILRCGFYKEHVTVKGVLIYIPKSIAFSTMDELEFESLYQKAIDIILKYFCIGSTEDELNKQVERILMFT
jgi:hypothetical protein